MPYVMLAYKYLSRSFVELRSAYLDYASKDRNILQKKSSGKVASPF